MEKLLQQCSELIINIAGELKAKHVSFERAIGKDGLFDQFNTTNGFSENIKTGLQKIAPEIKSSYAEFEVTRRSSGDVKSLYWILQDFYPWCITLTLMDDQQPLMALINDAEREELFTVIKGQGAFLNGKSITVNHKELLSDALVSTVQPNNIPEEVDLANKSLQSVNQMMPKVFALRLLGPASLQLADVAAGRTDAFWEYGNDIYDWLAGALLVKEAGGKALISESGIIAANKPLYQALHKLL